MLLVAPDNKGASSFGRFDFDSWDGVISPDGKILNMTWGAPLIHRCTYVPSREGRMPLPAVAHKAGRHVQGTVVLSL